MPEPFSSLVPATMDPYQIKSLFAIVAVLSIVYGVSSFQTFNDLRARFSPNPAQGFYELPWNTSSPLISNYVEVPADLGLPLTLYCYPNDPRVCLMFDFKGNIAGIQISFLYQDVMAFRSYYDYGSVGSFIENMLFNTPVYSMRAYFTNPTTLTAAGRQDTSQTVEGLWVMLNNTLYDIQVKEPSPAQNSIGPFFRQNCYPGMGQHYFFQVNKLAQCSQMTPFYPVYARGVLAGFGIADFGRGSVAPGGRVWYENPPRPAVDQILINRPPCLDQYVDAFGIYSLHVYFIDHPWKISCPA